MFLQHIPADIPKLYQFSYLYILYLAIKLELYYVYLQHLIGAQNKLSSYECGCGYVNPFSVDKISSL